MRPILAIAAVLIPLLSAGLLSGQTRYVNLSFGSLFTVGGASVSGDDLLLLQTGAHDPRVNGFTVQNLELSLTGAIDPFFNGEVHLIFQIDEEGESLLEVEEAFLTTRSMPGGLQVRAGTFFTGFGRLNPQHPHSWSYVDQPLVNAYLLGGDGLRGPGARLSWLTPLPWYSEVTAGLQNAVGETMVSFLGEAAQRQFLGFRLHQREIDGIEDLLASGRWLNAVTVGDALSMNFGLSALRGPNRTGDDGRTVIAGVDLFAKWQPPENDNGWPFVTAQLEAMRREYFSPVLRLIYSEKTQVEWGFYGQTQWGFKRGWVLGARMDYLERFMDRLITSGTTKLPIHVSIQYRRRWATNLTFYPSEFSKVRLQINMDDGEFLGKETVWGVWLQYEFLMGQHAGHKF